MCYAEVNTLAEILPEIHQQRLCIESIVFGIHDTKVRERLLREVELSLNNAVKICHASELAPQHIKTFSSTCAALGNESVPVGAVKMKRGQS